MAIELIRGLPGAYDTFCRRARSLISVHCPRQLRHLIPEDGYGAETSRHITHMAHLSASQ
jgi:hypothetical protein